ncbi:hypothetical protein LZ31DRAFT_567463 [Colletotrichum somersetense]|nr:hypothetical protein LZ31DRAFT_567463 [Colletotrichum somersetense]
MQKPSIWIKRVIFMRYGAYGIAQALCIDLEVENLGREGTVSILQIYVSPRKHTFVIDIRATLQSVLESSEITNVFFDFHNDSDALFAHFSIKLDGVQDFQLMEFASLEARKSFLCGLAKCIDRDSPLSPMERQEWSTRSLPREVLMYFIQDVQSLPQLWLVYNQKLIPHWRLQVGRESQARKKLSRSTAFNGQGRHKALPPAGWAS